MNSEHNPEDCDTAADDIAAEITKILVRAFVAKEGREPTADEVQMLIEELTEERIESMLCGGLDQDNNDTVDEEGEGVIDPEGGESDVSEEEVEPEIAGAIEIKELKKGSEAQPR